MSSRGHQETFSLGRVIEAPLHELVRSRFLNYAISVITDRALPDVRDGLKPVQRRILYAMYHDLHLTPDKPTLKCAKVVGQVLGSYHPHGDSAVYEAMARMAQPWTLRYPLVFGQGNFGSIDGDGPAAYRYTEAKLSAAALEFVEEIGQDTVDFVPNFDESTPEPKVLPARIPQMLVNGCVGIAVGVATNIPPHNIGEIMQACRALIDDRTLTVPKLLGYIKGPDFPTGGELLNSRDSLEEIYSTGQGPLKVRGTYFIEETGKRSTKIVIDSIPYMVNKSELVEEIGAIIMSGKIPQLQDVRDESAEDVRICLECRSDADPQTVMAYLFKNTKLQSQFNMNMTCLTSNGPERINLRTALLEFIDFRFDVTVRRFNHELRLLNKRMHILEGFAKVFDALDEAIAIIRQSSGRTDAALKLSQRFLLDSEQTDAILELHLYKISRDDILQIRTELAEKKARCEEIEALLNDMPAIWNVVKDESGQVRRKFMDDRRTKTAKSGVEELSYDAGDFIADETNEVVITHDGWLRRVPSGTDFSKLRLRMDDYIWLSLEGSTLSSLILFTDCGTVYTMPMHELPGGLRGFGEPVQKFFSFSDGEHITAAMLIDGRSCEVWNSASEGEAPAMHALAVSSDGHGVRFSVAGFIENSKKNGRKFMRLADGASVVSVEAVRGTETLITVTEQSRALLCPACEISFMSGPARGVQVIKLEEGDKVMETMAVTGPDQGMLLVRDSGGAVIEVSLKKQKPASRGGKGTVLAKRGRLQIKKKFYAGTSASGSAGDDVSDNAASASESPVSAAGSASDDSGSASAAKYSAKGSSGGTSGGAVVPGSGTAAEDAAGPAGGLSEDGTAVNEGETAVTGSSGKAKKSGKGRTSRKSGSAGNSAAAAEGSSAEAEAAEDYLPADDAGAIVYEGDSLPEADMNYDADDSSGFLFEYDDNSLLL